MKLKYLIIVYKWIIRDWWVVKKSSSGYYTYNPRKHTTLDTGLPYWQAKLECERLNGTY